MAIGKIVTSASKNVKAKKSAQGTGQQGAKRTKNVAQKTKDQLRDGVTKGDIRRIARRGGVKRISTGVFPCTRDVLMDWLGNIVRDALIFMEHAKRNTVFASDVVYALKRQGQNIYGLGT